MEELVLGLYILAMVACIACLWLWWELEGMKDYVNHMRSRVGTVIEQMEQLEKRRR